MKDADLKMLLGIGGLAIGAALLLSKSNTNGPLGMIGRALYEAAHAPKPHGWSKKYSAMLCAGEGI